MNGIEYLNFQVGVAGDPQLDDLGGDSIDRCVEIVKGKDGVFDIRRSAEWGGGIVATIAQPGRLVFISSDPAAFEGYSEQEAKTILANINIRVFGKTSLRG